MSGDLRRLLARVLALGSAYCAVSLLERMAATAEADAAAARLAAAAADEALFAHLTGRPDATDPTGLREFRLLVELDDLADRGQ